MTMDSLKLLGICVMTLLPLALLKKYSGEQAILLTVAVVAIVVIRCIAVAAPLIRVLGRLFDRTGLERSYIEILLRTAAAAIVTRICADLCRDGGSQTLATLTELAGTVGIMLIALPIFEAIIQLLTGNFS